MLQMVRCEIMVAEYLVELPPREMLEAKLHQAIWLARGQVGEDQRTEGYAGLECWLSAEANLPSQAPPSHAFKISALYGSGLCLDQKRASWFLILSGQLLAKNQLFCISHPLATICVLS